MPAAAWTVAPTFEDGEVSSFHSPWRGGLPAPGFPAGVVLASVYLGRRQAKRSVVAAAVMQRFAETTDFD